MNQTPPMSDSELRELPHSQEAEQAVLGAMIQSSTALDDALVVIDKDMFYNPIHSKVYNSIIELHSASKPVDIVTVAQSLTDKGLSVQGGNGSFVCSLVDCVSVTANVKAYAETVKDKFLRREVIRVSQDNIMEAYKSDSSENLLETADSNIFSISKALHTSLTSPSSLLVPQALSDIERIQKLQADGKVDGICTGFERLDLMTYGFRPGELIILAGRPSMGKTALALNIIDYVSVSEGTPTAIFSLEMSERALMMRMVSSRSGVGRDQIRGGQLTDANWDRIKMEGDTLKQTPIYVDDNASIGLMELRSKARQLKSRYNIGFIVVDYLQLMSNPIKGESREREIASLSRGFKAIAKEIGIPVLVLSQLSRQTEQRKDCRPQLSDLRESGAIEQDADVVLFVYREEYYKKEVENPLDKFKVMGEAEIIVAKQRDGNTGSVKLYFEKDLATFKNVSGNPTDLGVELGAINQTDEETPF